MRVQKILASAGIASRRACEKLIEEGRVTVNGEVITIGDSADPSKDIIKVDRKRVHIEKKVYLLVNKPKGVIVTMGDDQNRKTIMDLFKIPQRVFPVGRLDKDSEGLLLCTNDGDLAQRVLHPSYEMTKEYEVIVNKVLSPRDKVRLQKGFPLEGRKVTMEIKGDGKKLRVVIHEGRKHILRRIFRRIGNEVLALRRIRIGNLRIAKIPKGSWRYLTDKELAALRRLLKLS
jgi:pseudouridine synthase